MLRDRQHAEPERLTKRLARLLAALKAMPSHVTEAKCGPDTIRIVRGR